MGKENIFALLKTLPTWLLRKHENQPVGLHRYVGLSTGTQEVQQFDSSFHKSMPETTEGSMLVSAMGKKIRRNCVSHRVLSALSKLRKVLMRRTEKPLNTIFCIKLSYKGITRNAERK